MTALEWSYVPARGENPGYLIAGPVTKLAVVRALGEMPLRHDCESNAVIGGVLASAFAASTWKQLGHAPADASCNTARGTRPCQCDLPRCPRCGYTAHDAAFELDHGRCDDVIPILVPCPGCMAGTYCAICGDKGTVAIVAIRPADEEERPPCACHPSSEATQDEVIASPSCRGTGRSPGLYVIGEIGK